MPRLLANRPWISSDELAPGRKGAKGGLPLAVAGRHSLQPPSHVPASPLANFRAQAAARKWESILILDLPDIASYGGDVSAGFYPGGFTGPVRPRPPPFPPWVQ